MLPRVYLVLGLMLLYSTTMIQPIFAQNLDTTVKDAKHEFETPIEKLLKIQRLLNIYATIGRFSGVAVVTRNGEYIHKFTTNYATLDYKIRCSLASQFNACGITEIFTATSIMQLLDKGQLSLSDKIGQYLFDLPAEMSNITIHQLLTNTSGLKDYYDIDEYRKGFYDIDSMEKLIDIVKDYSLEFTPGTQYKKSASAYLFLGRLIEKVSGMYYQDYIEKNIFAPNDMKKSGVYNWFDPAEQKAVGYLKNRKNEPKEAPEYWGALAYGADGIHCSIEDMVKFNNAFQRGTLFSKEAKNLMLTPHLTNPDNVQEKIGYGLRLKESNNFKILQQGGQLGGIGTDLRYYIKEGYTVIIYSNYGVGTAAMIGDKIEEILTTHTSTVANSAVSFVLEEMIETKGIGYVADNFETILEDNHIVLLNPWPLYFLGKDYISKNQPNVAIKLYKLSIRKFPKEPMLYDALGECYFKVLGDCWSANQAFKKKLELQPTDLRAKRMLETFEDLACTQLSTSNQNIAYQNPPKGNNPFALPKSNTEKPSVQSPQTEVDESPQRVVNKPYSSDIKMQNKKIYTTAETMPEFPGGQAALHQYIYKNLQYPALAYANNKEGVVYIEFIVDEYGNVVNAKVNDFHQESDGDFVLEALRIINSMP